MDAENDSYGIALALGRGGGDIYFILLFKLIGLLKACQKESQLAVQFL